MMYYVDCKNKSSRKDKYFTKCIKHISKNKLRKSAPAPHLQKKDKNNFANASQIH